MPGEPIGEMIPWTGWTFDGAWLETAWRANTDELWLLLVVALLLFTVGVQGLFYPLFYKQFHFQAPSAIRWAYLLAFVLSLAALHWRAWPWLLVGLTGSYWLWLVWFLLTSLLVATLAFLPRKTYV